MCVGLLRDPLNRIRAFASLGEVSHYIAGKVGNESAQLSGEGNGLFIPGVYATRRSVTSAARKRQHPARMRCEVRLLATRAHLRRDAERDRLRLTLHHDLDAVDQAIGAACVDELATGAGHRTAFEVVGE